MKPISKIFVSFSIKCSIINCWIFLYHPIVKQPINNKYGIPILEYWMSQQYNYKRDLIPYERVNLRTIKYDISMSPVFLIPD